VRRERGLEGCRPGASPPQPALPLLLLATSLTWAPNCSWEAVSAPGEMHRTPVLTDCLWAGHRWLIYK
jgi:hypothetical protein